MEDLISREAAIKAINMRAGVDGFIDLPQEYVTDAIRALPSAQPERIRGRWIKMSDADGAYYCCAECGNELYRLWVFDREFDLVPHKESIPKTSYCPNCGADMRGGKE